MRKSNLDRTGNWNSGIQFLYCLKCFLEFEAKKQSCWIVTFFHGLLLLYEKIYWKCWPQSRNIAYLLIGLSWFQRSNFWKNAPSPFWGGQGQRTIEVRISLNPKRKGSLLLELLKLHKVEIWLQPTRKGLEGTFIKDVRFWGR